MRMRIIDEIYLENPITKDFVYMISIREIPIPLGFQIKARMQSEGHITLKRILKEVEISMKERDK